MEPRPGTVADTHQGPEGLLGQSPTVGLVAVGRPTFDLRSAEPVVQTALDELRRFDPAITGDGTIRTTAEEIAKAVRQWPRTVRVVVIAFATFADSTLAASAVTALADRPDVRVVLWSFPEPELGNRLRWNSMCGSILAAFRLGLNQTELRSLHRSPGDVRTIERLEAALTELSTDVEQKADEPFDRPTEAEIHEAARVIAELSGVRIGVVGDPPAGFEPCHIVLDPSPLGVTFDVVDLDVLFSMARSGPQHPTDGTAVALRNSVGRLADIEHRDPEAVEQSLRLHDALQTLAAERQWDGVAVRCWPECFTEWGGAACGPLSLLADSGLPSACEADGYGALTCALLSAVAKRPAFIADLVEIDPEQNTATFWHCGLAPRSMADPNRPVVAIDHPNRGIPLAFHFGLAAGPVTIARISQSGGALRLVIGEGEVIEGPGPFTGTSGTIRLPTPVTQMFDFITQQGLEHHFIVVPGQHIYVLAAVAERWNLPVVRLTG